MNDDTISRKAVIDTVHAAVRPFIADDGDELTEADKLVLSINKSICTAIKALPSVQPEIIHCCDCIYYDPEHIEKNGVRNEYRDMPKDAFDILGTGLVNSEYGINVGGRCCRDYNVGYSEDKRVFVSGQNYCGRAERKEETAAILRRTG